MNQWPRQDYESMVKFYGKPGTGQTTLPLPYPMHLTWEPGTQLTRITCHARVAESLERILSKTLAGYGLEEIRRLGLDRFSGCLNVRKMRGGSAWSIHSWGAAVDIDDGRNRLRWGSDRAQLAREEYRAFWNFVEGEGWVSLGRKKNYDWMHFQAALV